MEMQPQSRPKKLLILKDSNSLVVAPFLALSYDEICLVDLRLLGRSLMEYIREYQPDMVLTIYNPGAMEEHNRSMFQYQ
jgi:LmbE family N-acetylglucosaminyl deacetylase